MAVTCGRLYREVGVVIVIIGEILLGNLCARRGGLVVLGLQYAAVARWGQGLRERLPVLLEPRLFEISWLHVPVLRLAWVARNAGLVRLLCASLFCF